MAFAAASKLRHENRAAAWQARVSSPHVTAVLPSPLGRIGCLTVRLAQTESEIEAALVLRYQVFFSDHGGSTSESRDADRFDDLCDHLLVFDESLPGPSQAQIVGTYRLLRQERSLLAGGFYSAAEYDVQALVARHGTRRFLELGRSCVLPQYRSKRTVELLWQGIWAYCHAHRIDVMFGCASFPGTIAARHAMPLSFLHHHALAEQEWRVRAVEGWGTPMDLMPPEAVDAKTAIAAMPPLIKGYLRLGARFGEHAVIDREFGSTDVFVILRTEEIAERYLGHYGPQATRFA
jgi:L-ornithine Nalpha-acyltransferase